MPGTGNTPPAMPNGTGVISVGTSTNVTGSTTASTKTMAELQHIHVEKEHLHLLEPRRRQIVQVLQKQII